MRAQDAHLDLVEIAPSSRPPVCRIMDYGKFKYEQAKKAKLAKKKQHVVQMRAMRYRPKIDEHDFRFKTRHVREFLEKGSKVKVFVMFKGRERAHTEFGYKVLERVEAELEEVGMVEQKPKLEGRFLAMIMAPKARTQKSKPKRTEDAEDQNEPVGSQTVQEDGDRED